LNVRQRFNSAMHFRQADRLPFCEFLGYWTETRNRWYGEGLPWGAELEDYFDFDDGLTPSLGRLVPRASSPSEFAPGREQIPLDFGPIPRFPVKTLEEAERYRIERDGMGITRRVMKGMSTLPAYIGNPVRSREDLDKMKKRFRPDDPRRYPLSWSEELIEHYRHLDHPVGISMPGFFGQARLFMGLENLLIAFHRNPELVSEIMNFWADFILKVIGPAVKAVRFDYANIWEDMAYNRGPFISQSLFRRHMLPCYRKVTAFLKEHGIEVIMVDTDGHVEPLVPLFIEGGVNCLYPLEAQAGMDCLDLRERYGKRLLLIGNVDKRALVGGRKTIERELKRVLPRMIEEGGYIPSIDHSVPPDVPLQHYRYYIDLLRRFLGMPELKR
jgi:uroporphyrinogen-III decarboxylase